MKKQHRFSVLYVERTSNNRRTVNVAADTKQEACDRARALRSDFSTTLSVTKTS